MNLQDAMLNKLHEASLKATRDQSMMPQGLRPMSTQEGQHILSRLHNTPPNQFPKLSLRPMNASQGQAILDRLNNR